MSREITQRDHAIQMLNARGMVRMCEFVEAGVAATTITRMVEDDEVFQSDRGVYQSTDALIHLHHSLAVAAKLAPNSVVCLLSALSYHDITDLLPYNVWLAIGPHDRTPKFDHLKVRCFRFSEPYHTSDIVTQVIEGVPVRVYGIARTIADCFRFRN